MFHFEGHSHKTVSTNYNLSEDKGESKRNRAEALLLTGQRLTAGPNRLTRSHKTVAAVKPQILETKDNRI